MAIIEAIVRDERDPRQMAELRDGRVRAEEETTARLVRCHWRQYHVYVIILAMLSRPWIRLPRTLLFAVLLAMLAAILALNRPGVTPSAGAIGMDGGGLVGPGTGAPVAPQQASGDYDADDDGLIEVANLAQLDAIRYDLDGDGSPARSNPGAYAAAFPGAVAGMGCPELSGCIGYELVADLDFDTNGNGQTDSGDTYWNDRAGWLPIGRGTFSGTRPEFLATFDGGGHTIANLYINRGDYVGLFGSIGPRAEIRDVGLTAVNVTGSKSRKWVGSLVGQSGGSISGSYATGTVSGGDDVGGLVGFSSGSISDSYTTGTVSGDQRVGGLVGSSSGGSISDSYATGRVTGSSSVGGLAGVSVGSISGSYATGAVAGDSYAGGLVGGGGGSISDSHATGVVTGDTYLGGLIGFYRDGNISASYATGAVTGSGSLVGGLVGNHTDGSISASYATGAVTGSGTYFGGLVGSNWNSNISASYATGTVTGDNIVGGLAGLHRNGNISGSYAIGRLLGADEVGGLVGRNQGTVIDSYWDTVASGRSSSDGGQGKTTSELQSSTGYSGIYAGWNLDLDNADRDRDISTGGDDPWDFGTSSQYPVLKYGGLDVSAQRGGQTQTPTPPTEDMPLGPPTNVRVNPVGSGLVNVGWDRVPGAAGYTIIAINIANPAEARTKSVNNPDAVAGQIGNLTVGAQYNIYAASFDAALDFALDFSEKKRVTVE